MSLKLKIGQRIRQEREKRQISRERLCHKGQYLTVRQLLRIENGESLPSIEKLSYIAQELKVSLADLLIDADIRIPEAYLETKQNLIKFPTYGNPDRVARKQEMIAEAYENYYDSLPEEELLFLDLSENILNWSQSLGTPDVEEIYQDAFEQVQYKWVFDLNDLMLVGYYLLGLQKKSYYNRNLFNKLESRLLRQEISRDELYNINLLSVLISVLGVYVSHEDYEGIKPVIDKVYQLIDKTQQPSYRPSVLMVEAKYQLYEKGDKSQARKLYQQAIEFATMLGDPFLAQGLEEEKARDNLA